MSILLKKPIQFRMIHFRFLLLSSRATPSTVNMNSILRKTKHSGKADEKSFIIKNGGILLEKLIASSKGKYNPIRSFSVEEVKTATNNYDKQNVITRDSLHRVYKGFLHDRSVSVMKYGDNSSAAQEYGFTNIVFAAEVCHKTTLKLIGCCLETETPILVFESVKYGSLANQIHNDGQPDFEPLLWTQRLKIAMEIANVVAYFHVGFPRPIVFRNIKPSNILFNEEDIAKLFDCSLCISIPEDKTYVDDQMLVGTFGYLAPEYATSGCCDEKCDVFSFGASLLELLTGQRIIDCFSSATGQEYLLRDRVMNHIESNRFKDIVDPIIVGEGLCHEKEQQLQSFADVAIKCSSESPDNRPTMVDVAKQIRQLYLSCNSC